jgi:hypothetical protein
MTLWKESTNILPGDGDTVWVRRFPGIEHPKQAIFNFGGGTSSTFAVTVYAPTSATPTVLTIPAYLIHSWRPRSVSPPPPGACAAQEAAGDPTGVAVPAFVGQLYHDTVAGSYYRSTGETSADWTPIGGGPARGDGTFGLFTSGDSGATGDIVINDVTCVPGYDIEREPSITSLTFPNLVSIDPTNLQGGSVDATSNALLTSLHMPLLASVRGSVLCTTHPVLESVAMPLLTSVGADFVCFSNPLLASLDVSSLASVGNAFSCSSNDVLASLDMSSLASVGGAFTCASNTYLASLDMSSLATVGGAFSCFSNQRLTSLDVSAWVPTDGTNIMLSQNALTATSVELILRRCVLAGVTTCVIVLNGGTNAGLSSLSSQGQLDAAALGAQLQINP